MNTIETTPDIIATFIIGGEKVHLKSNTAYSFIGEELEFYKDEDGIINSNGGHQWTISDFANEVNMAKSFPIEL